LAPFDLDGSEQLLLLFLVVHLEQVLLRLRILQPSGEELGDRFVRLRVLVDGLQPRLAHRVLNVQRLRVHTAAQLAISVSVCGPIVLVHQLQGYLLVFGRHIGVHDAARGQSHGPDERRLVEHLGREQSRSDAHRLVVQLRCIWSTRLRCFLYATLFGLPTHSCFEFILPFLAQFV